MHQELLTIAAPVDPSRRHALDRVLNDMKRDPSHNDVLPFGALPGCHFGRLVLIPGGRGPTGDAHGDSLLLTSDCDGSADEHLEALVDAAGDGLDRLLSTCEGYPNGSTSRSARLAYLEQKRLRPRAYYVHQQGRTVDQIQREEALRKQLQAFVAAHPFANGSAVHAREEILAFVANERALSWALEAPPEPGPAFKLRERIHHLSLPVGMVALGPVAAALLVLIRLQEERDVVEDIRPTAEQMRVLTDVEDWTANSGYTAAAFVKPGIVRELTVAGLLELIGWGARHLFTRRSLAGVRTIHFARWIPLGNGRVVFISNYDGSVESYNNDFIDLVGAGLNLIFSNAYGYPRTRWLIRGGALNEQAFKDYLRRRQVPTPIWHSAYPHLTVANINRNAQLRQGLRGTMTEEEARRWLRLI